MSNVRAAITGIEAYLPEYVLTNDELSTLVDTNDEWITSRVGINTRRILKEDGLGVSYMAEKAIEKLVKSKNLDPKEVDLVICATVTPDMVFPATANIISDKCGFINAWGFDLNAGCSGFIFSFETVRTFIESGRYKKAILVTGERLSSVTDYTDRQTCTLFGDGAVAMLIEPTSDMNLGLLDSILHVDGIGRKFLYQPAGGSSHPANTDTVNKHMHFIKQDGKTVFRYAVSRMADVSVELMEKHNLSAGDIAYLVPHQANLRIIKATGSRMGLTDDKILVNIEKYGNVGGTSIPLVLCEFKDKFKKGDTLVFTAFGAGFTWGAELYRWAI
ncbi:MAG: ketoacyl-ACP synthase III [Bacteroidales bacterium]|jgi:3-oxoacyl-[acyl-carrier-protein] synthase-3|nr:ketoacyl-ACP synthase III [Bacteroidales bacterium]